MKKERIEEIKQRLNNTDGYRKGEESIWEDLKEAIAEIEFLETEIKKLQAVREAAEEVDWQIINECLDEQGLIRIKTYLKILLQALAAKGNDDNYKKREKIKL